MCSCGSVSVAALAHHGRWVAVADKRKDGYFRARIQRGRDEAVCQHEHLTSTEAGQCAREMVKAEERL